MFYNTYFTGHAKFNKIDFLLLLKQILQMWKISVFWYQIRNLHFQSVTCAFHDSVRLRAHEVFMHETFFSSNQKKNLSTNYITSSYVIKYPWSTLNCMCTIEKLYLLSTVCCIISWQKLLVILRHEMQLFRSANVP